MPVLVEAGIGGLEERNVLEASQVSPVNALVVIGMLKELESLLKVLGLGKLLNPWLECKLRKVNGCGP